MKKCSFLVTFLILFFTPLSANSISDGTINLKTLKKHHYKTYALQGKVPLYWNQFLKENERSSIFPTCSLSLPGIWNEIPTPIGKLPETGYCTFIVKVIPPKDSMTLAMKLPAIRTAYRLYMDSALITSVGIPATTADSAKPAYLPHAVSLPYSSEPFHLIFHVSNFDNNKGGPWKLIYIGSEDRIFRQRTMALAYDLFFIGILTFFVFIHGTTSHFTENQKEKRALGALLGFSLSMLIRTMLTGERFLYFLFPDLSPHIWVRLEYITLFTAGVFFHNFVHNTLKTYSSTIINRAVIFCGAMFTALVLLTPLATHSRIIPFFQALVFIIMIYQVIIAYKARKEPGLRSIVILISILILFATAFHDIVATYDMAIPLLLSPLANMIVIMLQTLIITTEQAKMYKQRLAMAQRLGEINHTLNRFVPSKVLDLLNTNSEQVCAGIQKEKELTVMVADIRGFTALSERMTPEMSFAFINRFLAAVSPFVTGHNGFINNFIGDAFIAIFPGKPSDAVDSALEIQQELISSELFSSYMLDIPLKLGIGIEFGNTSLGILGGTNRIENAVIGSTLEQASRLESLTKDTGAYILISQRINALLPDEKYFTRDLGNDPQNILKDRMYDLFVDLDSPESKRKRRTLDQLRQALYYIDKQQFEEAHRVLTNIPAEVASHDPAIAYLLSSCLTKPLPAPIA